MTYAPLIATLVALAAGPLVYAAARRHTPTLAFLDGFVLISIAGLVLLEVVPGTFTDGGPWSLAFLLAGLFGPTLLEHVFSGARRETHIVTLALAIAGLILHTLADGAVLNPTGREEWALALAVVLHSVPVGMAVWWLLAPSFGGVWPALALAAMGAGTIAGFRLGVSLNQLLGAEAWAWIQSLVAGSILHVVFGRPHLDDGADRPAPVRYEGLGNLLAIGALALISLIHASAALHSQVMERFLSLALDTAPALLVAYLVGGFVYGELPAAVLRWLSGGGRASQSVRGMALGLPLPVCSCSVLPLYQSLARRGAPPASALAFLIAAPEVGLTALLVSLPLLGLEMTLLRVAAAAVLAALVGYWVSRWAAGGPSPAPGAPEAHCHPAAPVDGRWRSALRAGLVDLVDGTAPWILAGLLIAAVSEPLFTSMLWTEWPDTVEVLLFATLGMPLYVCAAGITPLIAVLIAAGVSPGAAIAFLLTGPATNIATYGVLRAAHGRRLAWIFCVVTAAGAIAIGLAVNLFAWDVAQGVPRHEHEPGLVKEGALLLLGVLYAASLLRRGGRAFIGELVETGRPLARPAH